MSGRMWIAGVLAGIVGVACLAGEAEKAEPKAPPLADLKAALQPMLDKLELTAEQKAKADAVMSEATWKTTLVAFDKQRGGELFKTTHAKMREAMPAVMMPKMMAVIMRKTMKERMGKKAGPPTAEEIAAIRGKMQQKMGAQIGPKIMGGLEDLTAQRMKELLVDQKVLLRLLGEKVAEVALTDEQKAALDKALADAGCPATLIHGPDPVLIERMQQMLEKIADEAVAALKQEDAAAPQKPATKNKGADF